MGIQLSNQMDLTIVRLLDRRILILLQQWKKEWNETPTVINETFKKLL